MRIDKGFDAKANMGLIQKGKPGAPSLLVCSKTGGEVVQTPGTGGAGKWTRQGGSNMPLALACKWPA